MADAIQFWAKYDIGSFSYRGHQSGWENDRSISGGEVLGASGIIPDSEEEYQNAVFFSKAVDNFLSDLSRNGLTVVDVAESFNRGYEPKIAEAFEKTVALPEDLIPLKTKIDSLIELLGIHDGRLAGILINILPASFWRTALTLADGQHDPQLTILIAQNLKKHFKIATGDLPIDLQRVLTERRANCIGSTQLFYVIGQALGLRVVPMEVTIDNRDRSAYHVASVVSLNNNRYIQVDLTKNRPELVSQAFLLNDQYQGSGAFLINTNNHPLLQHRIRFMGEAGLVAYLRLQNSLTSEPLNLSNLLELQKRDPNNPQIYIGLGKLYQVAAHQLNDEQIKEKFLIKAEEYYLRARELSPDLLEVNQNLASLYLQLDEPEKALVHLNAALAYILTELPVARMTTSVAQDGRALYYKMLFIELLEKRATAHACSGDQIAADQDNELIEMIMLPDYSAIKNYP